MNFLKKFLGSSPKGEISIIPSGQLFLRRSPGSPKSASECLYTDAVASIRETSAPHNYVLVVQRAYEEGEEQLKGDDDEEDDEEVDFKDERLTLLDKSIKVHKIYRSGATIVSWKNIEEDDGETFEFVVDESVKDSDVDQFMNTIYGCCFERKYQRTSAGVTQAQLEEFIYDPETAQDDDIAKTVSGLIVNNDRSGDEDDDDDEDDSIFKDAKEVTDNPKKISAIDTEKPERSTASVKGEDLCKVEAELRLYDPSSGVFALQAAHAKATILDLDDFDSWLSIEGGDLKLGAPISSELDPSFHDDIKSFIFVYQTDRGTFSFLLKFLAELEYIEFKKAFVKVLWEHSNRTKWSKIDESEKQYILLAFDALERDEEMADEYEDEEDEKSDKEEESEDDYEEDANKFTNLRTGLRKEAFSHSENEDETDLKKNFNKSSQNKNLTISYKNDRSYVTRDNRIGVFKTTDDDELEFTTAIENLSIDGKKFNPSKMMLHVEDRSLVMQGENKDKLYRMDLERGKIVDEWKVKDGLSVVEFGPNAKFNQMTGEQTFLGISNKGVFKVDPRLQGDKIVEDQSKEYVTKNDFSSFGTTENGYIAVASNKGDIRLYDKLGLRAKSLIPAIGDAIKHVEVSADGRWLLATCKTYLMLIDLTIKEGTNAGKLGFQKSFGKDNNPKTRMLKISQEHIAHMAALTNAPLDFSQAHFNAGLNSKEQTIVSSSGPYAITWSLKKILRGDAEPYMIKRYSANVVADNFKFGTDKNVIIALQDDVGMVNKKEFRKANRDSLAFTPRRT